MKESRYYIKRLTSAEAQVDNNNVHEIYIRLNNDFDYTSFFQNEGVVNGTVRQIEFTAEDLTYSLPHKKYNLRFVYYENSNHEKRIPSLSDVFREHGVLAGDIVCLESRTIDGKTFFYITFNKASEFPLSGDSLYYSVKEGTVNQLELYKTLTNEQREAVFAYYIEHLEARKVGKDQVSKYSHTYIPHINIYASQIKGITTLFDVVSLDQYEQINKIAARDNNPDPNYAGAYQSSLNKYGRMLIELMSSNCRFDMKEFGASDSISSKYESGLPLQQIYYGAPGTGKSHEINEQTKGQDVIRTTFHPDSDYSTFVGAYKPTSTEIPMRDVTGRVIKDANGKDVMENRIIYEFVDQAFLQAYVKAWKNLVFNDGKKQYLVIEEINRGNCAQIFGDLFQLLDRNIDGFSDYPIQADRDMCKYLKRVFARTDEPNKQIFLQDDERQRINQLYKCGDDLVSKVLSGEILLLPNNLYIWATMNTSDQSLFPIDSAFKRRWDWRYMPIDTEKEAWRIRVNGHGYSWTSFLNIINEIVHEKTQSEDKQLGFYFCKAKDGVIDAETFVGKVLFYLWNDVFKDYGFDDDFFEDEKLPDGTFKPLAFKSFYDVKTRKVIESQAEKFLLNLKVERIEDGKEEDNSGSNESATAGSFQG